MGLTNGGADSRRSHSERLAALLRPMIDAIETEWPRIRDAKRQRLLRQAHAVLAQLAELEEGDL
jgi:hypothetical protein